MDMECISVVSERACRGNLIYSHRKSQEGCTSSQTCSAMVVSGGYRGNRSEDPSSLQVPMSWSKTLAAS